MSSHPAQNRLFVYGTLRRGWDNRHAEALGRAARFLGTARVRGRMYRVDWYPGVVCGGEEWVIGDLFAGVDEATLAQLDGYEGPNEFRRVGVEAWREDGSSVPCWMYEYTGAAKEEARIAAGEFTR